MRKPMARNPVIVASFWMLCSGSLIAGVLAVPDALRYDWSRVDAATLVAVCYSAWVAIVIAGTIWNTGLARLGSSRTAIYVNLQPIIAALTAAIFLGEPFTVWLVLGTALVLAGMWRLRLG
jgi:drug/metabolite transporter (DMT)-like permease